MDRATTGRVLQMLEKAMAAYGKPLPEQSLLETWFDFLRPFSLQVIARAFIQHCDESDFPPFPAAISRKCKLMDGRPTADEAWAIALASNDESETVVWTSEIAEAFSACRSILQARDKIGARVAFKDTYTRLVTEARTLNKPVKWDVSLGHDQTKRLMALERAKDAGLISAATAQALRLTSDQTLSENECKEGKALIKNLLADLHDGQKRKIAEREKQREADRQAVQRRKQEIASRVMAYSVNKLQQGRA